MLRLTLLLLTFAAMGGCIDAPAEPPQPSGQIDGAVVDHFLRPWANVEVRLVELEWTTRTTDLGGFSFFDVPLGFHTVEVTLPEVGTDRELVVVEADESSKTILQVYVIPPPSPYVSELAHRANVQMAQPGQICDDCRWGARLHDEHPVAVVIMAVWDGQLPGDMETHIRLDLKDQNDHAIINSLDASDVTYDEEGRSVLFAAIDGDRIRDSAASIIMSVQMATDNPVPHVDFELQTFMYLHYGMTDEAAALLS